MQLLLPPLLLLLLLPLSIGVHCSLSLFFTYFLWQQQSWQHITAPTDSVIDSPCPFGLFVIYLLFSVCICLTLFSQQSWWGGWVGGGVGRTCAMALCMDELNSVMSLQLSALGLTARRSAGSRSRSPPGLSQCETRRLQGDDFI